MHPDFRAHYRLDLAECVREYPIDRLADYVRALPVDSAYGRAKTGGWSLDTELLARLVDLTGITARGNRVDGKFAPVTRPGQRKTLDVRTDTGEVARFFGGAR